MASQPVVKNITTDIPKQKKYILGFGGATLIISVLLLIASFVFLGMGAKEESNRICNVTNGVVLILFFGLFFSGSVVMLFEGWKM